MAVGDESIGFGGKFLIDDGPGPTFVEVPKVVTLGIPNEVTGTVDSKRLDLLHRVIVKLATLKDPGSFKVKVQFTAATYARFNTLRANITPKNFRVSIPCDTGTIDITVPGLVTENMIEDLDAEAITVINVTIVVTGARPDDTSPPTE